MPDTGALFAGMSARSRIAGAVIAFLVVMGTMASEAAGTVRVQNANNPAGDPTVTSYRLEGPTLQPPIDFQLHDRDFRSFGLSPGTYTIQALPAAGWAVADIQCVGPSPTGFAIDVANGRVTLTHGLDTEQTCSFTNSRVSASGSPTGPPPSGLAPTPLPQELPKVVLPRKAALLRVTGGRRFAAATVRITRRSVIKARLLYRNTRVVGSTRVVRGAGTHVVRVRLRRDAVRSLRRQGLERVNLTLRVVVAVRGARSQVFRFGVRLTL